MIPYSVSPRPDTGVSNVAMGIWLFLASEAMLFGALFSAYAMLRVAAPVWPSGAEVLNVPLGTLNTVVLLGATLLVWLARSGSAPDARWPFLASAALALLFVAVKTWEYRGELAGGSLPSKNTFLALYFTLTGLHALHVLGGALANLWVAVSAARVGRAMTLGRARALSLYWLFVNMVWLAIFTLFYLS
jgi:heme/copper-type cytochrome/quinol oxidase subunit 3